METKYGRKQRRLRVTVIVLLVLLINGIFISRLMDIQIVNQDLYMNTVAANTYATQVIRAPRGEIYDRNGVVLSGNAVSYNVVINYAFMDGHMDDASINDVLLKLTSIMVANGEKWIDNLPITESTPYRFLDGEQYEPYIEKVKSICKVAPYATAEDVMYHLADIYNLGEFSLEEQRKLAGIRFEMTRKDFSIRTPYTFATNIRKETLLQIKERSYKLPGVDIDESAIRVYENDDLFPHIIGSVGLIDAKLWNDAETTTSREGRVYGTINGIEYRMDDMIGKSGAELAFEEYLKGKDGVRTIVRSMDGDILQVLEDQPMVPGNNIYMTIDARLQRVALDALDKQITTMQNDLATYPPGRGHEADSGAVAVVDVKTGEILVLASYPTYHLGSFHQDYGELIQDERRPLFNRALAAYTPGSIFKPVVALGALTEGVTTRQQTASCQRVYTRFTGYQPTCLGYHGAINVIDALRWSCNIYFYENGYQLGIDKLGEYAAHMGLGLPTGIELPESTGRMSSPDLKAQLHTGSDANWYPGDILQASIGQLDNQFTPLQFANYAATLANDGVRMKAGILKSVYSYDMKETYYERSPTTASAFESPEAFGIIRDGMVAASRIGSARATFGNYPITVAAKTGTPETWSNPNSTFIAYAPAENPEIAVCVVIEKGWHGYTGAPVAKAVFDAYFFPEEIQEESNIE